MNAPQDNPPQPAQNGRRSGPPVPLLAIGALLLVGGYLLVVASVGYYVRYTGGEWGRALSVALVFVALVALTLLVASGSMRARLRVYISKNFFSYRYDYREEWLRFTRLLAGSVEAEHTAETAVPRSASYFISSRAPSTTRSH